MVDRETAGLQSTYVAGQIPFQTFSFTQKFPMGQASRTVTIIPAELIGSIDRFGSTKEIVRSLKRGS